MRLSAKLSGLALFGAFGAALGGACAIRLSDGDERAKRELPSCAEPADCAPTGQPCVVSTCFEGFCHVVAAVERTPLAQQQAGDCRTLECDGHGRVRAAPDDLDVPPGDGDTCTEEICAEGATATAFLDAGAPCDERGICNGAGTCGVCLPGALACEGNRPRRCAPSGSWEDGPPCRGRSAFCGDGACKRIVAIAAGGAHGCAVAENGTMRCWGARAALAPGVAVPAEGMEGVVELAAGSLHACARLRSGAVRCWGEGAGGQLGDGSLAGGLEPRLVRGLTGATRVAAGARHTCALLGDGTARCWGDNARGQLGTGRASGSPAPPGAPLVPPASASGTLTPAEGLAPLEVVPAPLTLAAGAHMVCALGAKGGVACFGFGAVAAAAFSAAPRPGRAPKEASPQRVVGLRDAVGLALGEAHSCALLRDGTVRCWGEGASGQLGDGTTSSRPAPAPVKGLEAVVEIGLGDRFGCARTRDGTVHCWGEGASGQLGDGTTSSRPLPGPVSGLAGAVALAVGARHACALTEAGLFCWGEGASGQLGDGKASSRPRPAPVAF